MTFKFTDALISSMGFSILSGAGLVDGSTITKHQVARVFPQKMGSGSTLYLELPDNSDYAAVLEETTKNPVIGIRVITLDNDGNPTEKTVKVNAEGSAEATALTLKKDTKKKRYVLVDGTSAQLNADTQYLVDYYIDVAGSEMTVEAGKFATNFLIEATTLFRRKSDGKDLEAQFTIPNGKVQSAFTFSMAASGDPSTFDFTVDAFPEYLPYDRTKKVMVALNIVEDDVELSTLSYNSDKTTVDTVDTAAGE